MNLSFPFSSLHHFLSFSGTVNIRYMEKQYSEPLAAMEHEGERAVWDIS